jgi:hypothetical protein
MEAIYSVSADLLNLEKPDVSKLAAETGGATQSSNGKDTDDEPVRMIDPMAVLFSLKDVAPGKSATNLDHAGSYGVSLQGIMSLLFSLEQEPEINLTEETSEDETVDDVLIDDRKKDDPEEDPNKDKPNPVSSTETLAAFRNQIDHFLFELAKPSYAEACSAARLMQAVAFPILLCVKGSEAGWLPNGMLTSVAARVVTIMLNRSYGRDRPKGLFRQVQARYEASEQKDEFLRTVGEGALWAALLASLARMEADSLPSLIQQVAAILSVLACAELIATSNEDQLSMFIRTLIIRDAEFAVRERALRLAEAINMPNNPAGVELGSDLFRSGKWALPPCRRIDHVVPSLGIRFVTPQSSSIVL